MKREMWNTMIRKTDTTSKKYYLKRDIANAMNRHSREIFEGLYGRKNSVDEPKKLWSEVYNYEWNNIVSDTSCYTASLLELGITPNVREVVNFIIYMEGEHIGNEHFVVSNLNENSYARLGEVVKAVLKEAGIENEPPLECEED